VRATERRTFSSAGRFSSSPVPLGGDLRQRLQIAELQRGLLRREHRRRRGQPLRRLVLALGVDHLGALLALRLGLARDGALHLRGQIDLLQLDGPDLYTPGLGL
jgi:hypothetical protein